METNETTAITPLSSAPPPPQIIWVQPASYPLEQQPQTPIVAPIQPTATRGALPILIGVIGVGAVLIAAGLVAIALRPAPVPPAPVVLPQPVQVNPNCYALCGGMSSEQN